MNVNNNCQSNIINPYLDKSDASVSSHISETSRNILCNQIPQSHQSQSDDIKNRITEIKRPEEIRLASAYKGFLYWVKAYDHQGETNLGKLLLEWLDHCDGEDKIKNYGEFLELASQLTSGGYSIPEVPSEIEFEKAMMQQVFTNYIGSKQVRLALSHEKFIHWVTDHHLYGETNPGKLLMDWLFSGPGIRLINSYEEFVELASLLTRGGYYIPEVPTKIEFEKTVKDELDEFVQHWGRSYCTFKELRLDLSHEKFVHWVETRNLTGDPGKLLTKWLSSSPSARQINNYGEFVELANKLKTAGYVINEVPSKIEFVKAIKRYFV